MMYIYIYTDFYYKYNEREQASMYTSAPKGIVTGRSLEDPPKL